MKCIDIKTILIRLETIIQNIEQIVHTFEDSEELDTNVASLIDIDESMEKLVDIQKEIAEQLFYLGSFRETVRSKLYDNKLKSGDT